MLNIIFTYQCFLIAYIFIVQKSNFLVILFSVVQNICVSVCVCVCMYVERR